MHSAASAEAVGDGGVAVRVTLIKIKHAEADLTGEMQAHPRLVSLSMTAVMEPIGPIHQPRSQIDTGLGRAITL